MKSLSRVFAVVFSLIFTIPLLAFAAGPFEVMQGSATIGTNGSTTTTVDVTSSGLTILDWLALSVAAGDSLNFKQLNSGDIVVNNVTGGQPTIINGNVTGNGNVWFINPNGVIIGSTADINVGGFLAAAAEPILQGPSSVAFTLTGDVANNGNITINNPNGYGLLIGNTVENNGSINAVNHGIVDLVGNSVSNTGTIIANSGNIALVSGTSPVVSLDSSGDISVVVKPVNGPCVETTCVNNSGILEASNGNILLDAFINNVSPAYYAVNASGIISADSLNNVDGQVILSASGDNNSLFNVSGSSSGSGASLVVGAALVYGGVFPTGGSSISGSSVDIDAQGNILDFGNISATSNVSINAADNFTIDGNSSIMVESASSIMDPNVSLDITAGEGINIQDSGTNGLYVYAFGNGSINLDTSGYLNINSSSITAYSAGTSNISLTGNTFSIQGSTIQSLSEGSAYINITGTGSPAANDPYYPFMINSSTITATAAGSGVSNAFTPVKLSDIGATVASITVNTPSDLLIENSTFLAQNILGSRATVSIGNFSSIYSSLIEAISNPINGVSEINLYNYSNIPYTDPAVGISTMTSPGYFFQYLIMYSTVYAYGGSSGIEVSQPSNAGNESQSNFLVYFSDFLAESYGAHTDPGPPPEPPSTLVEFDEPSLGANSHVLLEGDIFSANSFSPDDEDWTVLDLNFGQGLVTTFPTVLSAQQLAAEFNAPQQPTGYGDFVSFSQNELPNFNSIWIATSNGATAVAQIGAGGLYDASIYGFMYARSPGGETDTIQALNWCMSNIGCSGYDEGGSNPFASSPPVYYGESASAVTQALSSSVNNTSPVASLTLQPLSLDVKEPEITVN